MSYAYDDYLTSHIANVQKAADWILSRFPGIIDAEEEAALRTNLLAHDNSKYTTEEYDQYDQYFYGNRSFKVMKNFNCAWLHHIHQNPHHWQYWILVHDDEPEECLEMPGRYVLEMIADWWSFSWKSGKLWQIFNWYKAHYNMRLHPKTRAKVEEILDKMRDKLIEEGVPENAGK